MSSKLERYQEDTDPTLHALRQSLANVKPYEPKPGDADYLTPEQVARIKADRRNDQ